MPQNQDECTRIIEREVDHLHQHVNRMLQAIGFVGGAVAIIVPLIAFLIGIRNDAAIDTKLTTTIEELNSKIEQFEERYGTSRGNPKIKILDRYGQEIEGKTIEVEIKKNYLVYEDEIATCKNSLDKSFDEFGIVLPFLIKNEGNASTTIEKTRVLYDGIFTDGIKIFIDGKEWFYEEWDKDFSTDYLPGGGYTALWHLRIVSSTGNSSWCNKEDFLPLIGSERDFRIIIYHELSSGITKKVAMPFKAKLVFNED